MEWNGMEWNVMEWNGMVCMERNRKKSFAQNLCYILSNKGPVASKIGPGGSQVHSNSFSAALWAASWAATAGLGSHWDTPKAHLGAIGPHLGAPGNHFGAPGDGFGRPKPPFWESRRAPWPLFFDLATFLPKIWKSRKNLDFPLVFQWFQRSGGFQNHWKIWEYQARSALERTKAARDGQDWQDWPDKWLWDWKTEVKKRK